MVLPLLCGRPAAARQTGAPEVRIERNGRDGTPASVFFTRQTDAVADAPDVFRRYLPLGADDELRFRSADNASADVRVLRYDQYYKNIRVEHGVYIAAAKNGLIGYISGNYYATNTSLATQPQLTEQAALNKALAYTGAQQYSWEAPPPGNDPSAAHRPQGRLVFIEDYLSGDEPDGRLHLAWSFDVYALQPLSRNKVYVDAASGRILFSDALIRHISATGSSLYSGTVSFIAGQTDSTTYALFDSTRGGGIYTYTLNNAMTGAGAKVTSPSTVFPAIKAVDAHWGAEKVYDYWSNVRGRLSYDNLNSPLFSYVDYGTGYNNAFWGGTAMFYGSGTGSGGGGFDPLVSLDVCAHEIGHGVCASTAALIYNRESGAMNEGFSDIWGAAVEYYADPHETDAVAKRTWDIGEEISATPLRSMSNPKLHGDPDTYGGTNWKPASSGCTPNNSNDNCGVHSNSGVLNKWFYLLTVGGSGTNDLGRGYALTGVGMDTSATIAYGTELSLVPNSNYQACRTNSINFATLQYGACSHAVEAVTRAWYAVGVDIVGYTPCTSQISFNGPSVYVSEHADTLSCPAPHTVQIPVVMNGPAPTGGNAVVTVTVTGGTAVPGVDYALTTNTLTFPAGGTAPQYLPVVIYDNGNVQDTGRYFDLQLTVNPNGSSAAAANVLLQTRVHIVNDDEAPLAGGQEVHIVGTSGVNANLTSPFQGSFNQGRIQYILTVADLLAAGVKPNAPITKVSFNVLLKQSSQPFSNYTIRLAHTPQTLFTNGFITVGFTPVFSGSVTTVAGPNVLTFNNSYTWNGTDNMVMEICFSNTSHAANNDLVSAYSTGNMRTAFNMNQLTTGGCTGAFISSNVSDAVPVMRFTQVIQPTKVETDSGAARTWALNENRQAYFYSDSDTQLIAALNSGNGDPGCVTVSVSRAGNGFVPAAFAAVNRSLKEFSIIPAVNDTAAYTATFYLTDTELNGGSPAALYLVRTTAATDTAMSPGNTEIVQPTVINALDYRGFRGRFSGFGRYMLTDGRPTLGVASMHPVDGIYVQQNPFRDNIVLSVSLRSRQTAGLRLYDITGRVVYQASLQLAAGSSIVTVPAGRTASVPGSYLLQVITADGIYSRKLVRE